ncbi:MAG TPA: nucleotide 5'-monophosphate nucleosidase PpnN, partial [Gammaproteobacteria bacterium]
MQNQKVTTSVSPSNSLNVLSQYEVAKLRNVSASGLHEIFRRCSLAVLTCGNETDDVIKLLAAYADFDVRVLQQDRGVRLEVINAPASAFVDGKMILGVKNHLFAVLRDIIYIAEELDRPGLDLKTSSGITNFVFHILRNAGSLKQRARSDVVVCWGGHSIGRVEYDYTKQVGYEIGLRKMNICTGCGAGAMKGPMKGAAIGHLKQRVQPGRYIGLSEPGIIASESPNPVVNELIIMPDIEKRLEAFVRLGHGFVVFPGGVGTAEEILFLLGILLHPQNASLPFPLIFTGPASSETYFEQIDDFLVSVLGPEIKKYYRIIIGDAP